MPQTILLKGGPMDGRATIISEDATICHQLHSGQATIYIRTGETQDGQSVFHYHKSSERCGSLQIVGQITLGVVIGFLIAYMLIQP